MSTKKTPRKRRQADRPGGTITQGVSIDPALLERTKNRATQRGLNWSEHVADLLRRDLSRATGEETLESLAAKLATLERAVQEHRPPYHGAPPAG